MVTAEHTMTEAQRKLHRIIRHLVAAGTPTMEAYRRIGSEIGHRPSWIQRVIGRREQVVVQAHDWLNISALCERLDTASARNEAAALRIRGEVDAVRKARSSAEAMVAVDRLVSRRENQPLVDEGR